MNRLSSKLLTMLLCSDSCAFTSLQAALRSLMVVDTLTQKGLASASYCMSIDISETHLDAIYLDTEIFGSAV